MTASPAGLQMASELLRALSRQLTPAHSGEAEEDTEQEEDGAQGYASVSPPRRGGARYDQDESNDIPVDHELESKFMEAGVVPEPLETEQLVNDLSLGLAEQRRRFEARIAELEDDKRRLTIVARRAKERTREIEELALAQIAQERAMFEDSLTETESRFEDERKRHLREMYDLETIHRFQLANMAASYEAWANQVEAEQNERLRLAEEERHLALDRVSELEELVRSMEVDKARQAEEYERRILQEQVSRRDAELESERKFREYKEARSAMSRKRVSEALNALVL